MNTDQLLQDIRHESNARSRGRKARLIRLADAGLIRPLTAAELASEDFHCAWPVVDMTKVYEWARVEADRCHEAAGGLYHACTVSVKNGVDENLPTAHGVGCRVTRVPVRAFMVRDADEPIVAVLADNVGPGFMETGHYTADMLDMSADDFDEDEALRAAEALVRRSLLSRDDVFETRAQAEASAVSQLRIRAGGRPHGARNV
jgi:hypothetical protein